MESEPLQPFRFIDSSSVPISLPTQETRSMLPVSPTPLPSSSSSSNLPIAMQIPPISSVTEAASFNGLVPSVFTPQLESAYKELLKNLELEGFYSSEHLGEAIFVHFYQLVREAEKAGYLKSEQVELCLKIAFSFRGVAEMGALGTTHENALQRSQNLLSKALEMCDELKRLSTHQPGATKAQVAFKARIKNALRPLHQTLLLIDALSKQERGFRMLAEKRSIDSTLDFKESDVLKHIHKGVSTLLLQSDILLHCLKPQQTLELFPDLTNGQKRLLNETSISLTTHVNHFKSRVKAWADSGTLDLWQFSIIMNEFYSNVVVPGTAGTSEIKMSYAVIAARDLRLSFATFFHDVGGYHFALLLEKNGIEGYLENLKLHTHLCNIAELVNWDSIDCDPELRQKIKGLVRQLSDSWAADGAIGNLEHLVSEFAQGKRWTLDHLKQCGELHNELFNKHQIDSQLIHQLADPVRASDGTAKFIDGIERMLQRDFTLRFFLHYLDQVLGKAYKSQFRQLALPSRETEVKEKKPVVHPSNNSRRGHSARGKASARGGRTVNPVTPDRQASVAVSSPTSSSSTSSVFSLPDTSSSLESSLSSSEPSPTVSDSLGPIVDHAFDGIVSNESDFEVINVARLEEKLKADLGMATLLEEVVVSESSNLSAQTPSSSAQPSRTTRRNVLVQKVQKVLDYYKESCYSTGARKMDAVISVLKTNGYQRLQNRGKGSHQLWQHPLLKKMVTVCGHSGADLVHHRTIKEIETQLTEIRSIASRSEESTRSSSSSQPARGNRSSKSKKRRG